uniref:Activating transcription factor 7-interacting protein Fn3 domain-containing protein n=1 Tax=Daphnia galeata TaxID=27404 RepID=A0A8J2RRF0_9CRUS|nr:unnamed protein product [Daphnia galeata]
MEVKMEKTKSSQDKSPKENSTLSTGQCTSLKMEDVSPAKVKAGLLLPCIDQCESMDSFETNKSISLKNNIKLNIGLASLQSSSEENSSHSSSNKRPRLADVTPASNAQLLEENNAGPSKMEKSLKRYSREELERIIMGHMVGFYKPFSDIDQELDSCKKKIENLQQKNNFLTKEVVDLRNIVKSFVTKDAKNNVKPMKQLRSVGVQVSITNEKNDNVQSYSGVVKREELKSPSKEFISRDDYRVPRHVEEYDSASSSSSVSIPERKREDSKGKDIPKQAITSESVKTKEEDDELMVMFDKSTNFTQSDVSLNQHQTVPLLEPIPPKPIITITKTTENGTSALRISWKFPEKSKHAQVVSYCVFMLSESKPRFKSEDNWIPVGGLSSRMSCIIPLGRRDKLRSRYQFKVIATDIHGRKGLYSDVAHADFP